MNSRGHLFISLGKSIVRIIGGIITIFTGSIIPLAICVAIAEIGGIAEELVDKR